MVGGLGDLHAFLGLDRLVQAFAPVAVGHAPAGELVDDDDLVLVDHVMLIAAEAIVGVQGLLDVLVQLVHGVRVRARPAGWSSGPAACLLVSARAFASCRRA